MTPLYVTPLYDLNDLKKNIRTFENGFERNKTRSVFMAMQFGCKKSDAMTRYDYDSFWTFECQVKAHYLRDTYGNITPYDMYAMPRPLNPSSEKKYIVERDKKRAEIPNFNWRLGMKKYSDTLYT